MTDSIWLANPSITPLPPVPPPGTLMAITQSFAATSGQTVFTLTDFTYIPGSHQLMVFVDGVFQPPTMWTETSTTSITLGFNTLVVGDTVDIVKVAA